MNGEAFIFPLNVQADREIALQINTDDFTANHAAPLVETIQIQAVNQTILHPHCNGLPGLYLNDLRVLSGHSNKAACRYKS
ncbi:hypothetical protein D3C79_969340 [compost metagenome]